MISSGHQLFFISDTIVGTEKKIQVLKASDTLYITLTSQILKLISITTLQENL